MLRSPSTALAQSADDGWTAAWGAVRLWWRSQYAHTPPLLYPLLVYLALLDKDPDMASDVLSRWNPGRRTSYAWQAYIQASSGGRVTPPDPILNPTFANAALAVVTGLVAARSCDDGVRELARRPLVALLDRGVMVAPGVPVHLRSLVNELDVTGALAEPSDDVRSAIGQVASHPRARS